MLLWMKCVSEHQDLQIFVTNMSNFQALEVGENLNKLGLTPQGKV